MLAADFLHCSEVAMDRTIQKTCHMHEQICNFQNCDSNNESLGAFILLTANKTF